LWRQLERTFTRVEDCRQDLARLRAIKQPEEIAAMKKAARLTTAAFDLAHDKLSQVSTEYELEAEFTGYFRSHDGTHAYDPIVAAGKNACTLHYIENGAKLHAGQFILIDIGARVDGYAADVTRTYAHGKISSLQQTMHATLYQAQQAIVELIEPHLPLIEYQKKVDEIMISALEKLGLIKHGDIEGLRNYFPHAVSHGLGIDVHDSLGAPRALEEGMVLTVEPGIYVPKKGIGLRLEDDILVTAKGHQNLTAASGANVL
jgi:Xaa-Pro aminopeptidase